MNASLHSFILEKNEVHIWLMDFNQAHAALNLLLKKYLGISADTHLEFIYNEHGKPALANHLNNLKINFNLSHSHELALIAFAKDNAVGVDIEKIRDDKNFNKKIEKMAARFFTEKEFSTIKALKDPEKAHAFFSCWTRKEAVSKALGASLPSLLNQIEVLEINDVNDTNNINHTRNWTLYDLPINEDYKAALACEKPVTKISQWLWVAGDFI